MHLTFGLDPSPLVLTIAECYGTEQNKPISAMLSYAVPGEIPTFYSCKVTYVDSSPNEVVVDDLKTCSDLSGFSGPRLYFNVVNCDTDPNFPFAAPVGCMKIPAYKILDVLPTLAPLEFYSVRLGCSSEIKQLVSMKEIPLVVAEVTSSPNPQPPEPLVAFSPEEKEVEFVEPPSNNTESNVWLKDPDAVKNKVSLYTIALYGADPDRKTGDYANYLSQFKGFTTIKNRNDSADEYVVYFDSRQSADNFMKAGTARKLPGSNYEFILSEINDPIDSVNVQPEPAAFRGTVGTNKSLISTPQYVEEAKVPVPPTSMRGNVDTKAKLTKKNLKKEPKVVKPITQDTKKQEPVPPKHDIQKMDVEEKPAPKPTENGQKVAVPMVPQVDPKPTETINKVPAEKIESDERPFQPVKPKSKAPPVKKVDHKSFDELKNDVKKCQMIYEFDDEEIVGYRYIFHGKSHPLSNSYPCTIKFKGKTHHSAEQAIAYQKAIFANDKINAEKILALGSSADPRHCTDLARAIKVDDDDWRAKSIEIIYAILQAKFADQKLRDALMKTKKRLLVHAHIHDTFLGSGVSKDDLVQKEAEFFGANQLGQLLMKLRYALRNIMGSRQINIRRAYFTENERKEFEREVPNTEHFEIRRIRSFTGPTSGHTYAIYGLQHSLSNLYRVDLEFDNMTFASVQQALAYYKADYVGDSVRADQIMRDKNPINALGSYYSIGVDERKWNIYVTGLLYELLCAKFEQCSNFRITLLETYTWPLVYAAERDFFFGSGLNKDKVLNRKPFKGANQLGHLLMILRDNMASEVVPNKRKKPIDYHDRKQNSDVESFEIKFASKSTSVQQVSKPNPELGSVAENVDDSGDQNDHEDPMSDTSDSNPPLVDQLPSEIVYYEHNLPGVQYKPTIEMFESTQKEVKTHIDLDQLHTLPAPSQVWYKTAAGLESLSVFRDRPLKNIKLTGLDIFSKEKISVTLDHIPEPVTQTQQLCFSHILFRAQLVFKDGVKEDFKPYQYTKLEALPVIGSYTFHLNTLLQTLPVNKKYRAKRLIPADANWSIREMICYLVNKMKAHPKSFKLNQFLMGLDALVALTHYLESYTGIFLDTNQHWSPIVNGFWQTLVRYFDLDNAPYDICSNMFVQVESLLVTLGGECYRFSNIRHGFAKLQFQIDYEKLPKEIFFDADNQMRGNFNFLGNWIFADDKYTPTPMSIPETDYQPFRTRVQQKIAPPHSLLSLAVEKLRLTGIDTTDFDPIVVSSDEDESSDEGETSDDDDAMICGSVVEEAELFEHQPDLETLIPIGDEVICQKVKFFISPTPSPSHLCEELDENLVEKVSNFQIDELTNSTVADDDTHSDYCTASTDLNIEPDAVQMQNLENVPVDHAYRCDGLIFGTMKRSFSFSGFLLLIATMLPSVSAMPSSPETILSGDSVFGFSLLLFFISFLVLRRLSTSLISTTFVMIMLFIGTIEKAPNIDPLQRELYSSSPNESNSSVDVPAKQAIVALLSLLVLSKLTLRWMSIFVLFLFVAHADASKTFERPQLVSTGFTQAPKISINVLGLMAQLIAFISYTYCCDTDLKRTAKRSFLLIFFVMLYAGPHIRDPFDDPNALISPLHCYAACVNIMTRLLRCSLLGIVICLFSGNQSLVKASLWYAAALSDFGLVICRTSILYLALFIAGLCVLNPYNIAVLIGGSPYSSALVNFIMSPINYVDYFVRAWFGLVLFSVIGTFTNILWNPRYSLLKFLFIVLPAVCAESESKLHGSLFPWVHIEEHSYQMKNVTTEPISEDVSSHRDLFLVVFLVFMLIALLGALLYLHSRKQRNITIQRNITRNVRVHYHVLESSAYEDYFSGIENLRRSHDRFPSPVPHSPQWDYYPETDAIEGDDDVHIYSPLNSSETYRNIPSSTRNSLFIGSLFALFTPTLASSPSDGTPYFSLTTVLIFVLFIIICLGLLGVYRTEEAVPVQEEARPQEIVGPFLNLNYGIVPVRAFHSLANYLRCELVKNFGCIADIDIVLKENSISNVKFYGNNRDIGAVLKDSCVQYLLDLRKTMPNWRPFYLELKRALENDEPTIAPPPAMEDLPAILFENGFWHLVFEAFESEHERKNDVRPQPRSGLTSRTRTIGSTLSICLLFLPTVDALEVNVFTPLYVLEFVKDDGYYGLLLLSLLTIGMFVLYRICDIELNHTSCLIGGVIVAAIAGYFTLFVFIYLLVLSNDMPTLRNFIIISSFLGVLVNIFFFGPESLPLFDNLKESGLTDYFPGIFNWSEYMSQQTLSGSIQIISTTIFVALYYLLYFFAFDKLQAFWYKLAGMNMVHRTLRMPLMWNNLIDNFVFLVCVAAWNFQIFGIVLNVVMVNTVFGTRMPNYQVYQMVVILDVLMNTSKSTVMIALTSCYVRFFGIPTGNMTVGLITIVAMCQPVMASNFSDIFVNTMSRSVAIVLLVVFVFIWLMQRVNLSGVFTLLKKFSESSRASHNICDQLVNIQTNNRSPREESVIKYYRSSPTQLTVRMTTSSSINSCNYYDVLKIACCVLHLRYYNYGSVIRLCGNFRTSISSFVLNGRFFVLTEASPEEAETDYLLAVYRNGILYTVTNTCIRRYVNLNTLRATIGFPSVNCNNFFLFIAFRCLSLFFHIEDINFVYERVEDAERIVIEAATPSQQTPSLVEVVELEESTNDSWVAETTSLPTATISWAQESQLSDQVVYKAPFGFFEDAFNLCLFLEGTKDIELDCVITKYRDHDTYKYSELRDDISIPMKGDVYSDDTINEFEIISNASRIRLSGLRPNRLSVLAIVCCMIPSVQAEWTTFKPVYVYDNFALIFQISVILILWVVLAFFIVKPNRFVERFMTYFKVLLVVLSLALLSIGSYFLFHSSLVSSLYYSGFSAGILVSYLAIKWIISCPVVPIANCNLVRDHYHRCATCPLPVYSADNEPILIDGVLRQHTEIEFRCFFCRYICRNTFNFLAGIGLSFYAIGVWRMIGMANIYPLTVMLATVGSFGRFNRSFMTGCFIIAYICGYIGNMPSRAFVELVVVFITLDSAIIKFVVSCIRRGDRIELVAMTVSSSIVMLIFILCYQLFYSYGPIVQVPTFGNAEKIVPYRVVEKPFDADDLRIIIKSYTDDIVSAVHEFYKHIGHWDFSVAIQLLWNLFSSSDPLAFGFVVVMLYVVANIQRHTIQNVKTLLFLIAYCKLVFPYAVTNWMDAIYLGLIYYVVALIHGEIPFVIFSMSICYLFSAFMVSPQYTPPLTMGIILAPTNIFLYALRLLHLTFGFFKIPSIYEHVYMGQENKVSRKRLQFLLSKIRVYEPIDSSTGIKSYIASFLTYDDDYFQLFNTSYCTLDKFDDQSRYFFLDYIKNRLSDDIGTNSDSRVIYEMVHNLLVAYSFNQNYFKAPDMRWTSVPRSYIVAASSNYHFDPSSARFMLRMVDLQKNLDSNESRNEAWVQDNIQTFYMPDSIRKSFVNVTYRVSGASVSLYGHIIRHSDGTTMLRVQRHIANKMLALELSNVTLTRDSKPISQSQIEFNTTLIINAGANDPYFLIPVIIRDKEFTSDATPTAKAVAGNMYLFLPRFYQLNWTVGLCDSLNHHTVSTELGDCGSPLYQYQYDPDTKTSALKHIGYHVASVPRNQIGLGATSTRINVFCDVDGFCEYQSKKIIPDKVVTENGLSEVSMTSDYCNLAYDLCTGLFLYILSARYRKRLNVNKGAPEAEKELIETFDRIVAEASPKSVFYKAPKVKLLELLDFLKASNQFRGLYLSSCEELKRVIQNMSKFHRHHTRLLIDASELLLGDVQSYLMHITTLQGIEKSIAAKYEVVAYNPTVEGLVLKANLDRVSYYDLLFTLATYAIPHITTSSVFRMFSCVFIYIQHFSVKTWRATFFTLMLMMLCVCHVFYRQIISISLMQLYSDENVPVLELSYWDIVQAKFAFYVVYFTTSTLIGLCMFLFIRLSGLKLRLYVFEGTYVATLEILGMPLVYQPLLRHPDNIDVAFEVVEWTFSNMQFSLFLVCIWFGFPAVLAYFIVSLKTDMYYDTYVVFSDEMMNKYENFVHKYNRVTDDIDVYCNIFDSIVGIVALLILLSRCGCCLFSHIYRFRQYVKTSSHTNEAVKQSPGAVNCRRLLEFIGKCIDCVVLDEPRPPPVADWRNRVRLLAEEPDEVVYTLFADLHMLFVDHFPYWVQVAKIAKVSLKPPTNKIENITVFEHRVPVNVLFAYELFDLKQVKEFLKVDSDSMERAIVKTVQNHTLSKNESDKSSDWPGFLKGDYDDELLVMKSQLEIMKTEYEGLPENTHEKSIMRKKINCHEQRMREVKAASEKMARAATASTNAANQSEQKEAEMARVRAMYARFLRHLTKVHIGAASSIKDSFASLKYYAQDYATLYQKYFDVSDFSTTEPHKEHAFMPYTFESSKEREDVGTIVGTIPKGVIRLWARPIDSKTLKEEYRIGRYVLIGDSAIIKSQYETNKDQILVSVRIDVHRLTDEYVILHTTLDTTNLQIDFVPYKDEGKIFFLNLDNIVYCILSVNTQDPGMFVELRPRPASASFVLIPLFNGNLGYFVSNYRTVEDMRSDPAFYNVQEEHQKYNNADPNKRIISYDLFTRDDEGAFTSMDGKRYAIALSAIHIDPLQQRRLFGLWTRHYSSCNEASCPTEIPIPTQDFL